MWREPKDDEYQAILTKPAKILLHPFVIDTAGDHFEDDDDDEINQPSQVG